MFEEDKSKTHFDVKRGQVITLLNSTIRPHVAMTGKNPEPTDAYACTYKTGDKYETLVFFHPTTTHEGVVYRWDEGPQPRENAKQVEREALKFLEAMGFQMDSLHFRKKSSEEQQKLLDSLPCFKANLSYLREDGEEPESLEMDDVVAVEADDADDMEAIDEIMVESIDEKGEGGGEAIEEIVAESELAVEVEEADEAEEELEVGTAEMDDAFEQAFGEEKGGDAAQVAASDEVDIDREFDEITAETEAPEAREIEEDEIFAQAEGAQPMAAEAVDESDWDAEAAPQPAQAAVVEAQETDDEISVAIEPEADDVAMAEPAEEDIALSPAEDIPEAQSATPEPEAASQPSPAAETPPRPASQVNVPEGLDLRHLAAFLASM